eukprot:944941-Karenia_brevis.AAC.1
MRNGIRIEEKKRKEEAKEQKESGNKRRRIQEEEDWHNEFWSSENITSRDIGTVERYDPEERVDKLIQEIEEEVEEQLKQDEEEYFEACNGE